MHNGGWFGMSGMGSYWLIPALVVVLVVFAALMFRRRSRDGR
jgi:uncharacterized membrane protein